MGSHRRERANGGRSKGSRGKKDQVIGFLASVFSLLV